MAGATGARAMTGLAAVSRLRSREASRATTALAALELVGDKLPNVGNRTDIGPLLGRVAAGALIGAAVARTARSDGARAAIVGGLVAFAAAHISFRLRRRLSRATSPAFAALVEDATVLALARRGARLAPSRRRRFR
jgi:uncharacterized membrane protein